MKKLLFIALIASLISCSKSSTPSYTVTAASVTGHWLTHWYSGDTLWGQYPDSNGTVPAWPNNLDTLITFTSGDTTGIVYHGTKYYLWKMPAFSGDTFVDGKQVYNPCYIGTAPLDSSNAVAKGIVMCSQYYDASFNNWKHQKQGITISNGSVFKPVSNGYWSSTVH